MKKTNAFFCHLRPFAALALLLVLASCSKLLNGEVEESYHDWLYGDDYSSSYNNSTSSANYTLYYYDGSARSSSTMDQNPGGAYTTTVTLSAGEHKFCFVRNDSEYYYYPYNFGTLTDAGSTCSSDDFTYSSYAQYSTVTTTYSGTYEFYFRPSGYSYNTGSVSAVSVNTGSNGSGNSGNNSNSSGDSSNIAATPLTVHSFNDESAYTILYVNSNTQQNYSFSVESGYQYYMYWADVNGNTNVLSSYNELGDAVFDVYQADEQLFYNDISAFELGTANFNSNEWSTGDWIISVSQNKTTSIDGFVALLVYREAL